MISVALPVIEAFLIFAPLAIQTTKLLQDDKGLNS